MYLVSWFIFSASQSLPVLLVDLGRVCGFRIAGAEEAEAVGGRVRAALHESFRERSEELFETGSAIHADTGTLAEVNPKIEINTNTNCPVATTRYEIVMVITAAPHCLHCLSR